MAFVFRRVTAVLGVATLLAGLALPPVHVHLGEDADEHDHAKGIVHAHWAAHAGVDGNVDLTDGHGRLLFPRPAPPPPPPPSTHPSGGGGGAGPSVVRAAVPRRGGSGKQGAAGGRPPDVSPPPALPARGAAGFPLFPFPFPQPRGCPRIGRSLIAASDAAFARGVMVRTKIIVGAVGALAVLAVPCVAQTRLSLQDAVDRALQSRASLKAEAESASRRQKA